MSELPPGFAVSSRNQQTLKSRFINNDSSPTCLRPQTNSIASLPYRDPARQEKRLPIRILKMLTAHTSHILHPEYLQPLSSAPVSIEVRVTPFYCICFLLHSNKKNNNIFSQKSYSVVRVCAFLLSERVLIDVSCAFVTFYIVSQY